MKYPTPAELRLTKVRLGLDEWTIRIFPFVKHRPDLHSEKTWGQCIYNKHTIHIDSLLSTHNVIDTIIHECLHACIPGLTEPQVNRTATQIMRVLRRLKLI